MTTTISGTSGVSQPQVSVSAAFNTPTAGLVTFTLNPCVLAFRNSTLSNGAVGTKTISSALTLATDNTGASFGATTAIQARLYLLAIDDGTATPRLGVTLGSGLQLDETNVLPQTTAITGAVTDGTKVYTTSGLGAGAYPYKVVGAVDATWTTVSGWITTPDLVQGSSNIDFPIGSDTIQAKSTASTAGSSTLGTLTDCGVSVTLFPGNWLLIWTGAIASGSTGGTGACNPTITLTDNASTVIEHGNGSIVKASDTLAFSQCGGQIFLKVTALTTYKLRFGLQVYSGTPTGLTCSMGGSTPSTVLTAIRR